MSYIQSEEHFLNYIGKVAREANREVQLLPKAFYVNYIYRQGKADAFTWTLKHEGAQYLEEPLVWNWLSKHHARYRSNDFVHQLTDAFLQMLDDVEASPGVYSFWSEEDVVLYVGRSKNLGQRIGTSFNRFHAYDRPIYVRHIMTQSAADAVLLEAYFITKWNPPLNGMDNYQDGVTLTVEPIPEWSAPVRCNWVLHKNEQGSGKAMR